MKSRQEKVEVKHEPQVEEPSKPEGVRCENHSDKEVEFYCQSCKTLICSICMILQHNGHPLLLLEDSLFHLMKEMDDLEQFYDQNITKEQSDSQKNEMIILSLQKQLDQNKIKQINLIRQGFEQIIESLIKRKESLIDETSKRFDQESSNFTNMVRPKTSIRPSHEIKSEAKILKELPSSGRKQMYNKAQTIKDFNSHLSNIIKESQDRMSQTTKFRELESLENNPQLIIKQEFNPVTIDTTAAISYIMNMTLENNSIINKGNCLLKGNDVEQAKQNSTLENQKSSEESLQKKDNDEIESKPSNQGFKLENMNFMKKMTQSMNKTTDTSKPVTSKNSPAFAEDDEFFNESNK